MGKIKPHGSAIFKIQEYNPEFPYVVGSTAHYSMGGELEILEIRDGKLILSMEHLFDTEISYQILLPNIYMTESGRQMLEIQLGGTGKKTYITEIERRKV